VITSFMNIPALAAKLATNCALGTRHFRNVWAEECITSRNTMASRSDERRYGASPRPVSQGRGSRHSSVGACPAVAIRLVGARPEPEWDKPAHRHRLWLGRGPLKADNLRATTRSAAPARVFSEPAIKVAETVVATRCVPPQYKYCGAFRSVRVGRGPFAFWGAPPRHRHDGQPYRSHPADLSPGSWTAKPIPDHLGRTHGAGAGAGDRHREFRS
jgi:hypothetical protein